MSEPPVPSAAALLDTMPFARTCGIELTEAGPERVTGSVAWAPERCTAGEVHARRRHHGAGRQPRRGVRLPQPARRGPHLHHRVQDQLLLAGSAGAAHGTTHPLHVGRSTIVVQTDVTDDEGRRVAQVTQTQAVLR